MGIRFNGVLLMLLALTFPSCNRGPDPVAKKPDNAPKADPPKVDVKPKEVSEEERLIEKAKALEVGKVQIELLRSVAAGDRAEYEWALLTRFPLEKDEEKKAVLGRAKWLVLRLTLIAAIDKSLEKDAKDKRFVNVRLLSSYVSDRGTGTSGGQLNTTKNLTLSFNSAGVFPGMLIGQFAFGDSGNAFTLKMATLDELVVPLAKEPRTIEPPYTLELARLGEEKIAVSLISLDTK